MQKDGEAWEADFVNDVNSDVQDGTGADEYFCLPLNLPITGSTDLAVLSHVRFSIFPLQCLQKIFKIRWQQ